VRFVGKAVPGPRQAGGPSKPVVRNLKKVGSIASDYTSRPYPRTAVLGSIAAVVAFTIGSYTTAVSAIVAAITALVSMRPTFHASAQEAFRQVLGVIIGASISAGLYIGFGFTPVTFFITVLSAYTLAWLLKLGEEGAVTMGVTIILVLADFSTDAIENRLLGVVLGVFVAMVLSYFARPGRPTDRVLSEALQEARAISGLLISLSTALIGEKGRLDRADSYAWLSASDSTMRRLIDIRATAEDALRGSRWSPWVSKREAQEVLRQVMLVRRAALTVHAICRDLHDSARANTVLPAELAVSLANGLTAAAVALEQQAETARSRPAELLGEDADAVQALRASREMVVKQMRALDDTRPMLLSGSLVRDTETLGDILSGD
jgi:uncharacterized membrane protein YgaE (UPF0421/DUF939 family)